MGRRLIARWESLPARRQIQIALPTLLVLLFVVHEGFFPRLAWTRSLMYSAMWALPFTLGIVFSTQVEVARKKREAAAREAQLEQREE